MLKKKINIYSLILTIITFGLTILFYNRLPEQIPTKWTIESGVIGYTSKPFGPFISSIRMVGIWIGMVSLPKVDPKKENYRKFQSSYEIVMGVIIAFLFGLQGTIILAALGYNISMNRVIMLMMGIMFVVIGNYLPKSKANFFYGIKTPWTLSSDVSWRKTHRLGGKLWVISGVLIIISIILFKGKYQRIVMVMTLMGTAVIPMIASYFYAKGE